MSNAEYLAERKAMLSRLKAPTRLRPKAKPKWRTGEDGRRIIDKSHKFSVLDDGIKSQAGVYFDNEGLEILPQDLPQELRQGEEAPKERIALPENINPLAHLLEVRGMTARELIDRAAGSDLKMWSEVAQVVARALSDERSPGGVVWQMVTKAICGEDCPEPVFNKALQKYVDAKHSDLDWIKTRRLAELGL